MLFSKKRFNSDDSENPGESRVVQSASGSSFIHSPLLKYDSWQKKKKNY